MVTGRLRVLCAAGLICLATLALGGQARAASYSASDAFYLQMPGGGSAAAIATSPDGDYVYVADATARRIVEFYSDGLFLRWWPRNNALRDPSSVTTDGFGNVYVLYRQSGTIVKYSGDGKKVLGSWTVPFAGSIAATRGGIVYVLTNFLNAVGVYNSAGQSIGGFVANLPGQWFPRAGFDTRYWPQTGYDPPYKTVAREIAVDGSGRPIVVGDSYQSLSDPGPDCSVPDNDLHIDTHPYPDPLDSGEAAEFTPSGTPIAYGWLSESQQNCYNGLYQQSPGLNVAFGWQSDATDPGAVAVDPNSGDVFAVSNVDLGVIRLHSDFYNPDMNVYAGVYDSNWSLIAGNPPGPVAVDCRSNLYEIGGGAASGLIAKFINQDPVPPGTCTTLNRFSLAPPPSLAVLSFHVGKIGKGTVLAGCSGRVCAGTLSLKSSSAICRACTLSSPYHVHMLPGTQRLLPIRLTGLGRRLLRDDPGLPAKIFGRVKGGRALVQSETLRQPSSLATVCRFPGTSGGAAAVSGTLSPADGRQRITIQYFPSVTHGLLLPAVQRTVLTNRAGRFEDGFALNGAGRWTIIATWTGDRIHEPAASQPCGGTVSAPQTQITLTCPVGSSAGTPAPFSGALAGAPPGAQVGLEYDAPPGADVGHEASVGGTGDFSDSFTPPAPGMWLALAHYPGDSGHAPATASCEFIVSPAPSSVTVQCIPDPNRHFISCTGQLTSTGTGIGGAQIKLNYQPPASAGSPMTDTASTAADGSYSDKLNAPVGSLLPPGAWQVQAQFAGDSTHAPASNTTAVSVP